MERRSDIVRSISGNRSLGQRECPERLETAKPVARPSEQQANEHVRLSARFLCCPPTTPGLSQRGLFICRQGLPHLILPVFTPLSPMPGTPLPNLHARCTPGSLLPLPPRGFSYASPCPFNYCIFLCICAPLWPGLVREIRMRILRGQH